jgi:cytoplasmic iron level regulating protein YaaA (DUF328/UPF0246 family)
VPQPLRILVPFADRKKPGGREGATLSTRRVADQWSFRTLAAPRTAALDGFREAMAQSAVALKVLKLTGKAFREAHAINRAFDRSRLASALERSNGTFAEALRTAELGQAEKKRLAAALLFVCPLFGVLSSEDMVPDFRCPEGAKLPRVGSLHKHWKPEVSKFFNRVLKGRHVLSFLPTRLAALWEPDGGAETIATVTFSRYAGEKLRGETAAAPGLVGEALRFVVDRDVRTPQDFAKFKSSLGHTFSASHSACEGAYRVMRFVR